MKRLLLLLVLLSAGCAGPRLAPDADGPPRSGPDRRHVEPEPIDEPPSRYGNKNPYTVLGRTYHLLPTARGYRETGIASWYGRKFHGRLTSSREVYDMYAYTAAHKTLPIPVVVRVTNLENGRSVRVRVNDRGPFHDNRIIDLSWAAARKLGMTDKGTALVRVEALFPDQRVPEPPQRTSRFWLQVGAFSLHDNARALYQRLKQAGLGPGRIQRVKLSSGQFVYRLQLGPLRSVEAADRLTDRLLSMGLEPPHIVTE